MSVKLISALSLLFLTVGFLPAVGSSDCLWNELLTNPRISNNADFWEEFNKLPRSSSGSVAPESLKTLAAKYGHHSATRDSSSSSPAFTPSKKIAIEDKAGKEILALPKNLKSKLDDFITLASKPDGLQELYRNPGRWHFEKVKSHGSNAHTIRLNDGYRVLFDLNGSEVRIRRVNKEQIHAN